MPLVSVQKEKPKWPSLDFDSAHPGNIGWMLFPARRYLQELPRSAFDLPQGRHNPHLVSVGLVFSSDAHRLEGWSQ